MVCKPIPGQNTFQCGAETHGPIQNPGVHLQVNLVDLLQPLSSHSQKKQHPDLEVK